MKFNWINGGNAAAVACLIAINLIAAGKGVAEDFCSKHAVINLFEQIGRYGCMFFMIFPVFVKGWEFGFRSVAEMLIWVCASVLLLAVYGLLWIKRQDSLASKNASHSSQAAVKFSNRIKKSVGGVSILYGLATVPVLLFLLNGILLRHFALIAAALFFGVFHLAVVRENIRKSGNTLSDID
ncbi:MAG: hypothetical protein NC541_06800 [bacterium]|nr:hypothetical protein [bacterium]